MDMNNLTEGIPTGEIVAKHIDQIKLKDEIDRRMQILSNELPPDAAAQMLEDARAIIVEVNGDGNSVIASFSIVESYLISYLANHSTPVIGGDNGMVHELDGTERETNVKNKSLWGTPLPWYELPNLDCKDEIYNFLNVLLPLYVEDATEASSSEIAEIILPRAVDTIASTLGGTAQ